MVVDTAVCFHSSGFRGSSLDIHQIVLERSTSQSRLIPQVVPGIGNGGWGYLMAYPVITKRSSCHRWWLLVPASWGEDIPWGTFLRAWIYSCEHETNLGVLAMPFTSICILIVASMKWNSDTNLVGLLSCLNEITSIKHLQIMPGTYYVLDNWYLLFSYQV